MAAQILALLPVAASSLPGAHWLAGPIAGILSTALTLQQSEQEQTEVSWAPAVLFVIFHAALLRLAIVAFTVLHELSHLVAAALVSGGACPPPTTADLLCNVPPSLWAQCLCPFLPWPAAAQPHVAAPSLSSAHTHTVRIMGGIFSPLLAVCVTLLTHTPTLWLAAWMVAFGAAATDLLRLGAKYNGVFRCGNFGMLVLAVLGKEEVDIAGVLREMAATTAARGGQSGGLVSILADSSALRERFVPSKRADVASNLVWNFISKMYFRNLLAFRYPAPPCKFFLGHTRFATSSAPTVAESHPHRFSNPKSISIWRREPTGWVRRSENFELYVTHNGDLEYYPLFGVQRTQRELGAWLTNVLGMKGKVAGCDSVKVAGILELLRTQGIWLHSMRLALQQAIAPSFDTTVNKGGGVSDKALADAADAAERVFADFVKDGGDLKTPEDVENCVVKLAQAIAGIDSVHIACSIHTGKITPVEEVARKAVVNFVENDMFAAMSRFLGDAHGSFGLSACCTVDRNIVNIASRGQAMCVSFSPSTGAVLWGSEAAAQAVPLMPVKKSGTTRSAATTIKHMNSSARDLETGMAGELPSVTPKDWNKCTHRHDLDENGGEVIEFSIFADAEQRSAYEAASDCAGELKAEFGKTCGEARFVPFPELPHLGLRVVKYHPMRCLDRKEFMAEGSLCDMTKVASTTSPHTHIKDKVLGDLTDIPRVLSLIQHSWRDENGHNRRTAAQFYKMLEQLVMEKSDEGRLEVDVLVTAVEASLWIGEQFASDLQALFPSLRVVPVSANKVIGVLSNTRGTAPMTGFSFCSLTVSLKRTIVVAISHSGQTFPTLHATHALKKICGNRVFVLTGSVDSKMASAVGQRPETDAPWVGRVWHTFSGWRPSEALTVSTVAAHQSLSELLLYCAKRGVRADEDFKKASGIKLKECDIGDIKRLNDCVSESASLCVGADVHGRKTESAHRAALRKQGRAWAMHVLEGPYAWLLSSAYIFGTVVSGYPIFTAIWLKAIVPHIESPPPEWAGYFVLGIDSLLFSFLPLFFCTLLRILQRRQLWARLGKRTIVIGDVPYVHQLLESYVSKLFSLSYSIASVEVHGANVVDHLVHRFTHRVARGVLIAVGRPDGRLFSMTKAESWVLMALQQCKAIVHFLAPPEVISVGHNPYKNPSVIDSHVTIPSSRPKFMCELLAGVDEEEPMSRLAAVRQTARAAKAGGGDVLSAFRKGDPLGVLALDEMTPEKSAVLHADLALKMHRATEIAMIEGKFDRSQHSSHFAGVSVHGGGSMHGLSQSQHGATINVDTSTSRHGQNWNLRSMLHVGTGGHTPDNQEIEASLSAVAGPEMLDRVISGMNEDLLELLGRGTVVELWHENRYASLERYLSFLVLFHAMAERVAAFPLLRFAVWRSQSQLRVATTAAPISAAEVEKEWAADQHHVECFPLRGDVSPDPTVHASRAMSGLGGGLDKSRGGGSANRSNTRPKDRSGHRLGGGGGGKLVSKDVYKEALLGAMSDTAPTTEDEVLRGAAQVPEDVRLEVGRDMILINAPHGP